nr:MAG TPA: hypothetical protein [Caudoviricetes sp.]
MGFFQMVCCDEGCPHYRHPFKQLKFFNCG